MNLPFRYQIDKQSMIFIFKILIFCFLLTSIQVKTRCCSSTEDVSTGWDTTFYHLYINLLSLHYRHCKTIWLFCMCDEHFEYPAQQMSRLLKAWNLRYSLLPWFYTTSIIFMQLKSYLRGISKNLPTFS